MPLGVQVLHPLLHLMTQHLVLARQADDTVCAAVKLRHAQASSFVVQRIHVLCDQPVDGKYRNMFLMIVL